MRIKMPVPMYKILLQVVHMHAWMLWHPEIPIQMLMLTLMPRILLQALLTWMPWHTATPIQMFRILPVPLLMLMITITRAKVNAHHRQNALNAPKRSKYLRKTNDRMTWWVLKCKYNFHLIRKGWRNMLFKNEASLWYLAKQISFAFLLTRLKCYFPKVFFAANRICKILYISTT